MTTLDKIKAEIEQIKPYDLPCDKRTPQNMLDMALEIVEKYAEQEQTGHWEFFCQHWRKCSECGNPHKFAEDWDYCPNCGARMESD